MEVQLPTIHALLKMTSITSPHILIYIVLLANSVVHDTQIYISNFY